MSFLILGAQGYLGKALLSHFQSQGESVMGTQHQQPDQPGYLNLLNPDGLDALPLESYRFGLICAAYPVISKCEVQPEISHQINFQGPLALSERLIKAGVIPVLFSSDYVFNGQNAPFSETSPLSPLNVYGRDKAELENVMERRYPGQYLMLRLTKVFDLDPSSHTLLTEMVTALRQGKTLRLAQDQFFNPILREDFISALTLLLAKQQRGLWNIGGGETISRYALGKTIAQVFEFSETLIEAIHLSDLAEKFHRPLNTSLATHKLQKFLPEWQPLSLIEAVQRLRKSVKC
ncbi:hypothetical protein COW36_18950 [bacterium (Candidatus Blackallbacteria) CG17_big_fil_post_rev_8_21_14_2_50_48_46]|uniref:RmlD-like substrate binding domain-containing protein n=1 Tax=bacterium (Candidatus Blackallbacteria) CG17_big_fil_post_rev_8_21_14_2_50_48_46 TaxID=2014261 RepID=A0A2M7FZZ3_9BACT|nr:MAG: hypothetical protein COW64_25520 [bacterium (Candidatus Blackallbacteria) CG18_big_fil_WC_8_21_14_2_50_49_26]PIW15006.1 MAG: hypothetical protein COW36_18950 [bacterium (Candidatus Blackallbacteria) CG17_big_fil_post_rev_8_21_14_2_50_48_46]PIW50087.1 MAG: hypothetical protein COW20_03885 [bacterium (Candidatus Blackallbacteria) CG13_big_fil_rev_8_21_14_2_50_49_14]